MKHESEYYATLATQLGQRIQHAIHAQHLDQTTLAERVHLSQSTLSNIINGKCSVSMKKLFLVMEALDLNPIQELQYCIEDSNSSIHVHETIPFINGENFIYDGDNPAFNGFLGSYYTYFYSTNTNETNILHGYMNLSSSSGKCKVDFQLMTTLDSHDMLYNTKLYNGYSYISPLQEAMYIILTNDSIGEMCFLTIPYKAILRKNHLLDCAIALVLTVSSGIDSRIPTVHRMLLSRKKLTDETLHQLSGQLLLNKSLIRILDEDFEKLCEEHLLSQDFIDCFNHHMHIKTYYEIQEESLKDLRLKNGFFEELCTLRKYSSAPKNNKVKLSISSDIYRNIIKPPKT